jgi:tetratricopeptide (TPR) repeat protein
MAWHELVYAYAANFCETCAAVLRCAAVCCSYMYLGVALTRLEDHDNAAAAYRKAISIDPQEPLFHLNYGEQAAGCNLSVRCVMSNAMQGTLMARGYIVPDVQML